MNLAKYPDGPVSGHRVVVTPLERDQMVAVAAYFRAEDRGFAPGHQHQDWCEAAATIDRMLANMHEAGVTRRDYERVGLRNALRLWVEQGTRSLSDPANDVWVDE